jgi:hypothetical protein
LRADLILLEANPLEDERHDASRRSVSTSLRQFPFAFREQPPVWTPATTSTR